MQGLAKSTFLAVAARSVSMALLATCLAAPSSALAATGNTKSSDAVKPNIAEWDPSLIIHSAPNTGFAKAASDTFNIYGGVQSDGGNDRRPEGLFQDAIQFPLEQGWTGHDLTENPTFWHASTFNASNLDPSPGNRAIWAGVEAGTPGFTTAPGYGNGWDDRLEWRGQTNPTVFTNVRLEFAYNYDLEGGFDFFTTDYDSAGTWINWVTRTGSSADSLGAFSTPTSFDESILYTPFMLTGGSPALDVHLRLRVTSDGGWSDEDGFFPSNGAAQVDNIKVSFNGSPVTQFGDGTATFDDLGGGLSDNEGWLTVAADFAGDFSKVLPQLRDTDPCRTNLSPQIGWIDDGTPPSNAPSTSTGGTTSVNWDYGVLNSWVVNYNGGLTAGLTGIQNEYWSPEIDWDDPSTTADDGLIGGAFIRYTRWQHLPLTNGLFWTWQVRSDDGNGWTPWQSRGFVYYGDGGGTYNNAQTEVSNLLVDSPVKVQMAFGVLDLAATFAFAGIDATPSPTFDAVSFWRYNLGGPAFSSRNIDLFQDAFAQSGDSDASSQVSRDLMDIRIDMARDISTGALIAAGDSIIVDVISVVPGVAMSDSLNQIKLHYSLNMNPLFEPAIRGNAPITGVGSGLKGWDQSEGVINASQSTTPAGAAIGDRYFFDLPDVDFMYPGDVLEYYIEAVDDDLNTTSFPGNLAGYDDVTAPYSRVFTVRGLPTLRPDGFGGVTHPSILVVNDFGHRGGESLYSAAFAQNGLVESEDLDIFTVKGPSSLVSNGIGSAGHHGASASQLSGYDCIIYESGNLSSGLLSDGSNAGGNDKGDDIGTLLAWHGQEGDRYMVHFGDNLSSFLSSGSGSQLTYLSTIMGVDVNDNDVRDEIGNQAVPIVIPSGSVPAFGTTYAANGGCLSINQFDSILPRPGSLTAHEFSDGLGGSYGASASVWYERSETVNSTSYSRIDLTFPHGFIYVANIIGKQKSLRSLLLEEVLTAAGHSVNLGNATPTDPVAVIPFAMSQNHPNPFNPATEIRFSAPRAGQLSLRVYNLRGELVRTLVSGDVRAGAQTVRWDGSDDSGAGVSSGIYLYRLDGFGEQLTRKMVLLK